IETTTTRSHITRGIALQRTKGVSRGTRPNYIPRTHLVRLTFAMGIYGVAFVDRHGDVGHWITGSSRDSDQCDPDHRCQYFHLVLFLVRWRPNEKENGARGEAVRHGPEARRVLSR